MSKYFYFYLKFYLNIRIKKSYLVRTLSLRIINICAAVRFDKSSSDGDDWRDTQPGKSSSPVNNELRNSSKLFLN